MQASTVPQSKPPAEAVEAAISGKLPPAAGADLPLGEAMRHSVERAVQRLNEVLRNSQRSLSFHFDESSGRTVITVLDATTNEIVRQIPAPEVLAIARRFEHTGALVDTRA